MWTQEVTEPSHGMMKSKPLQHIFTILTAVAKTMLEETCLPSWKKLHVHYSQNTLFIVTYHGA